MARIAISPCKGGNVQTITLKAFNEAQFREIIDSLS
jgi:uncharacterized protein with GYD domain